MYKIKAQGYGGVGPSVPTKYANDIATIKEEIAELIDSDHAVQLYRVDGNGVETRIEFDYYTTIVVTIGDDMP